MNILDNDELVIAGEFSKMVDEIVKLTNPKASARSQNDKSYLKAG